MSEDEKRYYTIGETSRITGVKPYILRYWESEFNLLKPIRTTRGQRRYEAKDHEQIFQIRDLLYSRRYTIAGAKRHLQERRTKPQSTLHLEQDMAPLWKLRDEIRHDLQDLLKLLK